MKKVLLFMMLTLGMGIVSHAQDNKDKTKATSTVPQKVHNTFSKHKKHKGYKTKHKHNGITKKHKVDVKEGEVKNKVK